MSCNDDKTYEPCSCGCGGSSDCNCDCGECAPLNCIEQAIRDALACLQEELEALVKRAEDAAKASEDAAAASAASAAEAKGYRDAAELAATTATDALKTITDVAVSLEETAKKLQEIADELATAIAGIAVVTWYYTAVSEGQTVIPVPEDKNALDVQCIYIEGVRQEPGRGFVFDKTTMTITLAEGIPLGLEISIILGTYSDNPTDFPQTLASNNGASLIGTSSGNTVQEELTSIDTDLIKLKLNWAIESGYSDSGFTFQTGGTLGSEDADKVIYDSVSKTWYSWSGTLPKVVSAGTNPLADANWKPQIDPNLRDELSAASGYSVIGEFASIAALRAFTGTAAMSTGSRISVRSYYVGGNTGGGFFRWDAASTDADDGGYTITPTGSVGAGRWKREFSSQKDVRTVSILEFGAKVNDSTFDNAPAFNAAVKYLNPYTDASFDSHQGGDVVCPAGQYYQNDTLYWSPNVRIIGTGGDSGFRYSRAGCSIFIAMPTMDPLKVLLDTAPWLTDGSARYTVTNSVDNGLTLSQGYYGPHIENMVFFGLADQQAGIRIWRTPDAKVINCAVYQCKVSFWVSGSWGTAFENCFAQGAKYATFLTPHTTALNIVGGYFTGNTSQTFAIGTAQWFHRAIDASNRPNIAYVTTFLYAHDAVDINMHGVTWEGYYRDFALFYSGNVNIFGGYNENSVIPSSDYGHTVWAHCVGSRLNAYGVFLNHGYKDFAVQSGNLIDDTTGLLIASEISNISLYDPRVDSKFVQLTKDLGYGSYNIYLKSKHPITQDLSVTLAALRNYTVQCDGLLDQYTMRIPTITPNGTTSFSFTINNLTTAGDYDVHFILRNAGNTVHQDIRFNMLIGNTVGISSYEARSRTGTATFAAPTITYDNAGTATITFLGNSGNYSVYRVKCVPRENQPLFIP